VTGLAVDFLNSILISTSLDGNVNFSQFSSKPTLLGSIKLGSSVTCLAIVKESGLIAVACDDLVVRVIDIESRRVVRRFAGHRHAITVRLAYTSACGSDSRPDFASSGYCGLPGYGMES
jgi:U3 small nucleolar RNA-associated protein 21